MEHLFEALEEALTKVTGFIYPNEVELQWSILIVLYPYITGLVAGAFILASLERVFNVEALRPTYRLSLLSALAFLIVAPMPLNLHLGHPERSFNIFLTPNANSAMAMFGFIYVWYLMAVLNLEIWFDYRRQIVGWAKTEKMAFKRWIYKILTFGVTRVTPGSLKVDDTLGRIVTVVGLPSAILLHGYVGFIFGSIKANPWWSTPLMPVIFLFSAMASGIAAVMLLYMFLNWARDKDVDMKCLDMIGKYFLTALIVSFSLEMLETIQKSYEAEEHFDILVLLVEGRLYFSLFFVQIFLGAIIPMILLGLVQIVDLAANVRKTFYALSGVLALVGIFAMRWNVVVGGQFFSKSLRGFTTYKLELVGLEGLFTALIICVLPFVVLGFLLWLLPPWEEEPSGGGSHA